MKAWAFGVPGGAANGFCGPTGLIARLCLPIFTSRVLLPRETRPATLGVRQKKKAKLE